MEILDRSGVSISQISPLGLKHIVGMLVLGYERGVDLPADYLESLFCLYRMRVENLYDFWLRPRMAIGKGFATNDRGWKDYFFFVRLDEASVSEECLPVFRRSWGRRGNEADCFTIPLLLVFNFTFAFQFTTPFLRYRRIYLLFETSYVEVRFSGVTLLRQESVQQWRFTDRDLVLQSRKMPSCL